jgi:hypothetical protein
MDQQVLSQTRISVFRAFPLSSDLESLALLFLRSLLAPHPQEFLSTSNTMRELLNRIAPAVEGVDPEDAFTVHTRVREYFREMEPMFRNPGVPDDLWFDSLILVARCLSEVHGFGLCHTVGGSMGQERSGPLRVVLHEVANLAARARVALFDTEERDAIIRMTCEGMLAEIDRSGRGSRQ